MPGATVGLMQQCILKRTFSSTRIVSADQGYKAMGQMTIHGISKDVTLNFEFIESDGGGEFVGYTTLDRNDFGIAGNFFGFAVGDEFRVDIRCEVAR